MQPVLILLVATIDNSCTAKAVCKIVCKEIEEKFPVNEMKLKKTSKVEEVPFLVASMQIH